MSWHARVPLVLLCQWNWGFFLLTEANSAFSEVVPYHFCRTVSTTTSFWRISPSLPEIFPVWMWLCCPHPTPRPSECSLSLSSQQMPWCWLIAHSLLYPPLCTLQLPLYWIHSGQGHRCFRTYKPEPCVSTLHSPRLPSYLKGTAISLVPELKLAFELSCSNLLIILISTFTDDLRAFYSVFNILPVRLSLPSDFLLHSDSQLQSLLLGAARRASQINSTSHPCSRSTKGFPSEE